MAEIFNVAISSFIIDNIKISKIITEIRMRRKRRFLVVPRQIIDSCVSELREKEIFLVVNLDNDPTSMIKDVLGDDKYQKLKAFLECSPCFRFTLLRKYIKYTTRTLNEKNVKKIIFVTSDVSLFKSLGYESKTTFGSPSSTFAADIDPDQKHEVKSYNDSIEKKGKKIKFDNVREFNKMYEKYIS